MTRFTVIWSQAAQDRLAQFWIAATDRAAVSAAANAIDRELAEDPGEKGVEVAPAIFELTVLPLRVLYEVSEADRQVKVAGVKLA